MKFTKLSLVAALAVSSAFAGGNITPVEPVVEAPVAVEACNSNTTINGKLQGYYITDDSIDLFDGDSSQLGFGATLDVSHNFTDWLTANFSAVGYLNAFKKQNLMYMEGDKRGAFFNVANLTATYGDTTLVAGRQLLDTPMLGGFDWLLAPGSFEAYTVVNKSISNLTLVGSYVAKWRPNNSGENFINLTDVDDGNNWTIGASYSDAFDASIWYYNVDAGGADLGNGPINPTKYTQIYVDTGVEFSGIKLAGQYIGTYYDAADDSTAFGAKVSTAVAGFDLMAAYNNVEDNQVGFIGRDSLYTSSWNTFTSTVGGNSFKVEVAKEFGSLSATASYAYYEYDQGTTEGSEFDLILGYKATDCISLDAVFTNTDWADGADAVNALELVASYKF